MFVDGWIQQAQGWLNTQYRNVDGFSVIAEDGSTGWQTIFALRRALQHELGISDLSDNFGPTTLSRLESRIGDVTTSSPSRVIGIVQCGLWCKGYWGDDPFGTWTSWLAASIATLRTDIGLSKQAVLSPKAFKSLLSMDAYSLRENGTSQVQDIQRWLNGRYASRSDYDLIPCDGVYSRDVQRGLMLAVQYEIGMADGVANGNFGQGTRQGVRGHGKFGLDAADGNRKMVSLYQASLILNGFTASPFSGRFDAATGAETRSFQAFSALPVSGSADFPTWASLLVSTGDTTRNASACDTNVKLTASTAAQLQRAGYRAVGRYINGNEKRIGFDEPATIAAAGLKWFPIYQEANDAAGEFSAELGDIQGQRLAIRMRQLGIASGSRVYVAVDFDATGEDIPAHRAAFRGAQGGVGAVEERHLSARSLRNSERLLEARGAIARRVLLRERHVDRVQRQSRLPSAQELGVRPDREHRPGDQWGFAGDR